MIDNDPEQYSIITNKHFDHEELFTSSIYTAQQAL